MFEPLTTGRDPADGLAVRAPVAPSPVAASFSAPRWGLGDVAIGLLMSAGAAVAVVAAVLIDRRDEEFSRVAPDGWTLGTLLLINVVVFVGVPLLTSRRKGTASLRRDFGLAIWPGDVARGLAGAFVAIAFSAAAVNLLTAVLGAEVDTGTRYVGVTGAGQVVAIHVVVGLMVPMAEELFFRGMLLRSLQRRNGPILSLVASSALFALLHVSGATELGSTQAAILVWTWISGMVFGALTLGTGGRLGSAIVAHVALNQAVLLVALG